MGERNRVTPDGRIVATDVRGAWMGNRGGPLHGRGGGHTIVRTSAGGRWIICALSFRGRRVPQWVPGLYTPLFFLDEAVALAAGHRPCALCRRPAFTAFCAAWAAAGGPTPRADDLDERLRAERGQTHPVSWADLPTGTFVVDDGGLALVLADGLVAWDAGRHGYGGSRNRPRSGDAQVRTPPSTVAVLRAGYQVQIDAAVG